jgi:hypothetical protein
MRMKRLRFVPCLVSAVTAAAPITAQPIPAATPEGIFCTGTYIAIGRVLDAANTECPSEKREGCSPDDLVDLKVEITEVMGARKASPSYSVGRNLHRGDIIPIRIRLFASLVITAIPPPKKPMPSNQQIRNTFVNKEFVFSVVMMDHDVKEHSTFSASVWPASEKAWALDTMTSEPAGNCPQRL